jgi:hypothetical protein
MIVMKYNLIQQTKIFFVNEIAGSIFISTYEIIEIISKIINIGIRLGQSLSEIRKIKLLNQIVLLFVTLIFIRFLSEILVWDIYGIGITTSLMGMYSLSWNFPA